MNQVFPNILNPLIQEFFELFVPPYVTVQAGPSGKGWKYNLFNQGNDDKGKLEENLPHSAAASAEKAI